MIHTEEKKKLADRFGVTDWDGMREVDWIILAALEDLKDSQSPTINVHNEGAAMNPDELQRRLSDMLKRGRNVKDAV